MRPYDSGKPWPLPWERVRGKGSRASLVRHGHGLGGSTVGDDRAHVAYRGMVYAFSALGLILVRTMPGRPRSTGLGLVSPPG